MEGKDLFEEALRALDLWREENPAFGFYVGVDVGGTNTRVAIGKEGTSSTVVAVKFKSSEISVLLRGLSQAGEKLISLAGKPATAACVAVAGPISDYGETVIVTNYEGDEESKKLTKSMLPSSLFPDPTKIRFVNDLEGACHGILALNEEGNLHKYFKPLWNPPSTPHFILRPHHYVVLSVGTGLGSAVLLSLGRQRTPEKFDVLPLEMSHIFLTSVGPSNPGHDEETALLSYLSQKLYKGHNTLEYEDICSGRGLKAVYEWAASLAPSSDEVPPTLPPDQILSEALKDPPFPPAQKAMYLHYRFLVRLAQSLCVGFQAKGVFFAGDNQVTNEAFFDKCAHDYHDEFLDHPKKQWLTDVKVFGQKHFFNMNLHGCLFIAKHMC